MKLHFLGPLYARPGPVASVYLDTSRDTDEDPDRAVELRWRQLREALAAQETDPATIGAVGHQIGADRDVPGPHGQAIFAAHGRLSLAQCLPEPPPRDSARYDMLPDPLLLAVQHAPGIRYAAVEIHRLHAPEAGVEDELELDHETGSWPMSRVAPGRPVHRRVPADGFPKEADALLTELADSMDTDGIEVIVLAGDPWACNTLTRLAPRKLRDHLVKLKEHAHRRPERGRALLEAELGELFAGRLPERDQQQLDQFLTQRARHSGDVEGLAATVSALQRGQAQALILNQPPQLSHPLWVGMAPTQLALTRADLSAFGLTSCWEEPAGPALIRAAAGTQAELITVPRDSLPLEDGLAVLLRYLGP